MTDTGGGDVVTAKEGRVGRIRLNRPKAIHALTTDMCLRMLDALAEFESDGEITCVVLDHVEGRGFCAGGDIRMLAESMTGDGVAARAFFHTEYRLDHRLFSYSKPLVSIMNGITMGGGVGIALPCKYRIVTENTRFAMPETAIGLFPDVGGSWYLSRLPGQLGKFVGLTGARLNGAECLFSGLATHYLVADAVPAAIAALHDSRDISATLKAYETDAPTAPIVDSLPAIDRLFGGDTVSEIIAALEAEGGDWALKQLATLRSKSPLSMAVVLRQLREGAEMTDFATVMQMEYRVAVRVAASPDFIEGVRAVVIDKDNAPQWQSGVTPAQIEAVFAPLPAQDEWTKL